MTLLQDSSRLASRKASGRTVSPEKFHSDVTFSFASAARHVQALLGHHRAMLATERCHSHSTKFGLVSHHGNTNDRWSVRGHQLLDFARVLEHRSSSESQHRGVRQGHSTNSSFTNSAPCHHPCLVRDFLGIFISFLNVSSQLPRSLARFSATCYALPPSQSAFMKRAS